MSNKRENDILENYKAYKELNKALVEKEINANKALVEQNNAFLKNYYNKIDKRRIAERSHGQNITEARNYFFGNALKGIYIGALEAATLNDEGLFLAEQMVDSYISENGGYDTIMSNVKADTYLLAKIRRLVEDAAEDEVNNLESAEDDIENTEDIEIKEFPEDEKDEVEVANDTKLTTANITDIVSALNKAGLEVVNKGEEADNFKESQPETDTNKPELDVDVNVDDTTTGTDEEIDIKEPEVPEDNTTTTDSEPTTDAVPDNTEDTAGAENNSEPTVADTATTEAPSTPDAATDQPTTDAEPAAEEDKTNSEPESEPETDDNDNEEDELDKDLADADKIESEKDNKVAEDDNLDPDSIAVNDDSDEDSDDDEDLDIEDDVEDDEESDENNNGIDDDLEEDEDDEEIEDIDVDGDGDEDFGDVDEPDDTVNVDPNKTMMDELENEKEVQDAVELIRNRVADAEEAFIKRNQEDKQKMDELLSKISHNVATVEKIANDNSDKAESDKKTLEESTRMYKQKINEMSLKSTTIFDKMTRNISESIIKDPKKVELFLNESGTPDFGLITETAKVMYAFLETLNTLQLEKVDGEYIRKAISGLI